MDTALAVVATFGTALFGGLSVWLRYQEVPDRRALRIQRDLEIVGALPAESTAKTRLRAHVEESISLMLDERKRSRNLSGALFGLFTVAYGIFLYGFGSYQGGWWRTAWAFAALFVVAGTFGVIDGLRRGERDSEGLIIWKRQQRSREARQATEQTQADVSEPPPPPTGQQTGE